MDPNPKYYLSVCIHLRWWVIPYLSTVKFFCLMFNQEPNLDRVMFWVLRGLYVAHVNVECRKLPVGADGKN